MLNIIDLFKANRLDLETNIFISFIIMSIICFILNILLIIFTAGLLIYLCIAPKSMFDYYKSKKMEIDMSNLADFKDNPDYNGNISEIEDFKNNPDFKDIKDYSPPSVDDSLQKTPTPDVY